MSASAQADAAQARLVTAARAFASFTPRKNPSGAYARALQELLSCRDDYARKTDEEWAQQVVNLKALLRRCMEADDCSGEPLSTLGQPLTDEITAALEMSN